MRALRGYIDGYVSPVRVLAERLQKEMRAYPTIGVVRSAVAEAVSKADADRMHPVLEAWTAKCELELERRVNARVESALSALRQPADGAPGKDGVDGKDGADVEDFNLAVSGRVVTVSMTIGGDVVSREIKIAAAHDAGVYKSGSSYDEGAIVTFSGSAFIASRDVTSTERPESSTGWRLLVKRGRDGKDAV